MPAFVGNSVLSSHYAFGHGFFTTHYLLGKRIYWKVVYHQFLSKQKQSKLSTVRSSVMSIRPQDCGQHLVGPIISVCDSFSNFPLKPRDLKRKKNSFPSFTAHAERATFRLLVFCFRYLYIGTITYICPNNSKTPGKKLLLTIKPFFRYYCNTNTLK